ncbi:hypothetical protein ACIHEJ_31235 [Streptomyces sp. NPDC052301]|uniref:hypothetical protein n=1 Tax=Streptomyces sp. NPDC052301 TaxID=3365687 RepID=UPI0037CE8CAA
MKRLDRVDHQHRTEQTPGGDRRHRLGRVDRTREPIYARLVAEWRADGRAVPAQPEVVWAPFLGLAPGGRPERGRP